MITLAPPPPTRPTAQALRTAATQIRRIIEYLDVWEHDEPAATGARAIWGATVHLDCAARQKQEATQR